ncbi:MAG: transposase [Oscillospiraceae bacterium]|jgi:transposase|nr:transposase [Oscillospiraceae bacterium]
MQVDIKVYKTINSESMIDYFEFSKTCYPKAPKIYIILDQGGHTAKVNTREFATKNDIVLHHLPPHSLNLNSIE